MIDLIVDFETFYSQEYSLRKMTMQEYLLSPQFQVIGCSIGHPGNLAWVDGPEVPYVLRRVDWSVTNLIGHNLLFDGGVLAQHYGYWPKLYSCTLSYARALMGALLPRLSLEVVAGAFGLRKDTGALSAAKGLRYEDLIRPENEAIWARYRAYAIDDSAQAGVIYAGLMPAMPGPERVIVDILIRMFTEGRLVLEPVLIEAARDAADIEARTKLAAAGVSDVKDLRSRDKFAEMLRALSVTPPTKKSSANGEMTYAFAKDDLKFVELLEHPDPRVSTLVDAKLNAASTIHQTRATRLLAISGLTPEHRLQVPIAYSGAHTHRFSGLDRLNLQNIPNKPKHLRRSIRAPKGYLLVVRDASQIEARILAFIAGQWDLVHQFAQGEDVYAIFAEAIYRFPVDKKTHPAERFIGKTGILGLGYGSGAYTFHHMVLTHPQRPEQGADLTHEDSCRVVDTYRARYGKIRNFWYEANRILPAMEIGERRRFGPCYTGSNTLDLPSGLKITYPQLMRVPQDEKLHPDWGDEWQYWKPRYKAFAALFGAKVVENMVQALARIQITDAMIRMRVTNPGWHCALQVHDELVYLAPADEAEDCDRHLSTYMNMQPAWTKDYPYRLPLANEGGIGEVYGDVK